MQKTNNFIMHSSILLLFSILAWTGCETTSENGGQGELTLQFQTITSSTSAKVSVGESAQLNDTLRVSGSNGTLVIDDIRFIVEDFELERSEGECEDLEGAAEENCEEFESEPFFVDLPLEGEVLELGTSSIEPGLYSELEFEVDDLELDEEESEERQAKEELITIVKTEFPDWPESSSMVITGTFIDSEGTESAFKAFAEAELEIELEFNPPLEVSENTVNKLLKVNINPAQWFLQTDGSVVDLSQYDFDSTGNILELEVEVENGFTSIEIEEEDEDEDED
jgi:hypothetical protein